jgi:hypothetical protein
MTADTVDVCLKSTRLSLRNQNRWKTTVDEAWAKDRSRKQYLRSGFRPVTLFERYCK